MKGRGFPTGRRYRKPEHGPKQRTCLVETAYPASHWVGQDQEEGILTPDISCQRQTPPAENRLVCTSSPASQPGSAQEEVALSRGQVPGKHPSLDQGKVHAGIVVTAVPLLPALESATWAVGFLSSVSTPVTGCRSCIIQKARLWESRNGILFLTFVVHNLLKKYEVLWSDQSHCPGDIGDLFFLFGAHLL